MSFIKPPVVLACAALVFSATAAFAQAGGADVPSDAKKQGTMENGASSTGQKGKMMKKDEGAMKGGAMEKKSGDKM